MPIYEFYCPDNHTVYRFFARRAGLDQKVPRCPADPAFRLEKRVSSFAIVGTTPKAKREQQAGEDGLGADEPRMERAMMEMEREMSGMDEENPDARQLGRMMRRMSELTGEKGDVRMEEMIRRLESGEDPEKMEEDFGDEADGEGGEGTSGDPPSVDPGAMNVARHMMSQLRAARRKSESRVDPELYELEDFLGRQRA